MTQGRQEQFWDGATWVYDAIITNDGVNSGTHIYDVSPGVGNELEILYGQLRNLDTVGRIIDIFIEDDVPNALVYMSPSSFSLTQSQRMPFPVTDEALANSAGQARRWLLSGGMNLSCVAASIAVSQDTRFSICCRIRGGLPTVTLTSPTDATETVNINQVF